MDGIVVAWIALELGRHVSRAVNDACDSDTSLGELVHDNVPPHQRGVPEAAVRRVQVGPGMPEERVLGQRSERGLETAPEPACLVRSELPSRVQDDCPKVGLGRFGEPAAFHSDLRRSFASRASSSSSSS